MKHKKICIFCLCIALALLLSFIAYKYFYNNLYPKPKTEAHKLPKTAVETPSDKIRSSETVIEKPSVVNKIGNLPGNLSNFGLIAQQGNWVYFFSRVPHVGIYKAMPDLETAMQKICDDDAYSINVVGEWIYYIEKISGKLYKINTKGKNKTLVLDTPCQYVVIKDNWIYYWTGYRGGEASSYKLNKRNITGDSCIFLCEINTLADPLTIDDNYIYYSTLDYTSRAIHTLWRINLDGSNKTQLTTTKSYNPLAYDGWIYFVDEDLRGFYDIDLYKDKRKLWRIKSDGSNIENVGTDSIFCFNIINNYVYYMDFHKKLYRINKDGSNKTELKLTSPIPEYTSSSPGIGLTQDYLVIFHDNESAFYTMKYDGTIQKCIK